MTKGSKRGDAIAKTEQGVLSVPISQVEAWDKNPRSIKDSDFARLKKHITKHGQYKPLICYRDNGKYVTLGGNMRLRAMQDLGVADVKVLEVHPKSEKEKIELSLIDNDRAGYYDDQQLAELIYPFKDELDLGDFKVDLRVPDIDLGNVLDRYAPSNEKDDEVPEVKKTNIKLGDLFQLGKHRLLCGDATKKEDIERLMDGKKADMVFTDPPSVIGDDKEFDPSPLFEFWGYCPEIFLWGGDYYIKSLPMAGSWIVWDKRLDDSADKMYGSCFELCWSKAKHKRDIARIKWAGIFGTEQEHDHKKCHPTQKPVLLAMWFFVRYKGNHIVDPFLGSGSTLIACEKLNRICYGTEIDSHYCQVIIDRWQNYTGQKVVKIG